MSAKPAIAESSDNKSLLPGAAALNVVQAMTNMVVRTECFDSTESTIIKAAASTNQTSPQMVNTGRYIRETKAGLSPGVSHNYMKQTLPAITARFHTCVDELQAEIKLAQTVIRRDLALLQAERRKREQAEALERQRLAFESAKKNAHDAESESKDVEMGDVEMEMGPPSLESNNPAANPGNTESTNNSSSSSSRPTISTTNVSSAPARDPLFDPTPTTGGNAQDTEYDFDAIFSSHDLESNTNDTSKNPPDLNMDTSLPNLDFTDQSGGGSLLRGLEDFANSSTDHMSGTSGGAQNDNTTNNTDLHMLDMITDSNQNQNQTQQQAPLAPMGGTQPADQHSSIQDTMADTTNFDDLFTFGYEDNPEGTEFEDAFMGFGEN